jgi:DNA-directed RNA polymerase subunit RPC12/RpoP
MFECKNFLKGRKQSISVCLDCMHKNSSWECFEIDYDCDNKEEITCPHCGYHISDSWDYNLGQDETTEVECHNCEREFKVTCNIKVDYTSAKKREE